MNKIMEKSDKIIHKVVEDYFKFPEKRLPLSMNLPSDFSIIDFYNEREQIPDVIGKSGVVYSSKK